MITYLSLSNSYNNSYDSSIKMVSYEALYGREDEDLLLGGLRLLKQG